MPVTMPVTAIILAAGLTAGPATSPGLSTGLVSGQISSQEQRLVTVQTYEEGITYQSRRNDRRTGARPTVGLTCAGRNIRFTLSGLPLSAERHQDIQLTIGDWSRPLYRAALSQDWAESVTSPALLNAIRSQNPMTVTIDGRDYRLRPQTSDQHIDFAQMCALAVDAALGNHPPQSVIVDPDVEG